MTTTVQLPDGATRDALGPTLIRLQEQGVASIIVADADLGKSTSARKFREAFPERFITFGVAEQNMISSAAGMSTMGQTVVASTFAVFMEHAFDQLRMSVAQPNLNVKIFASHSGVSAGEALVRKATTRPLPKARSTASGAPLRRRAITLTEEPTGGAQPVAAGKYRSTQTVSRKLLRSSRKIEKIGWSLTSRSGDSVSRTIGRSTLRAASGKGNRPSPSR